MTLFPFSSKAPGTPQHLPHMKSCRCLRAKRINHEKFQSRENSSQKKICRVTFFLFPSKSLENGNSIFARGATDQSWKMSNPLHGPISTNQILPREKHVNHNIFGTSNLQNRTYGVSCDELMWINYQYMELCPLILNCLHKSCFF